MIWSLLGWALFGGVFGYSLGRWRILFLPLLLLVAVSWIAQPSPPGPVDGSWWNSVAIVVGTVVGNQVARRGAA